MPRRKQEDSIDGTVECLLFARHELEPFAAHLEAVLSDDERARQARFVREEDRVRFSLYRGALRHLLARRLRTKPEAIRFRTAPGGKPELDPSAHPESPQFNISHSGDWFCAAFARAPVGVDVELTDRRTDALAVARHAFHAAETNCLEAQPEDLRRTLFFRWWTAKEALLKAWGTGLVGGLGRIDLSAWQNDPTTRVADAGGRYWKIWTYRFECGVVSIAAPDSFRAAILRSISGPGAVSGELITRSS